MMSKHMTLLNVLQWKSDFFEDIELPSEFDRQQLIGVIVDRCALVECVYNDVNLFHTLMLNWFAYKKDIFKKLWETMHFEYNPIENYDRVEEYTRDTSGNVTTNSTSEVNSNDIVNTTDVNESTDDTTYTYGSEENTTSSNSENASVSNKETTSGSENVINSSSAFNESTFSNDSQSNTTKSAEVNTTGSTTNDTNGTSTLSKSGNDVQSHVGSDNRTIEEERTNSSQATGKNEEERTDVETFTSRVHGNIGVTTSQQMIEAEREVVQFHVYDFIASEFENKFMICCY